MKFLVDVNASGATVTLLEETLARHGAELEAGAIVIATTRKLRVRWPFRQSRRKD